MLKILLILSVISNILIVLGVTFDSKITFEVCLRSFSRAAPQKLGNLRKYCEYSCNDINNYEFVYIRNRISLRRVRRNQNSLIPSSL